MNQLTTTAKVKAYMGITDASSDTLIDGLILQVGSFISDYCGGRIFDRQDYVETYDTYNGRHKIFLKQIPVTAVSAVKYRAGTPSSPVWNTYNADSYLPYLNAGYIHFYGALPTVAQGLQVSYTAGFLIDFTHETDPLLHTLPQSLTMAANEMIANILNTRRAAGITSETTEGQTIQYDMQRAMTSNVKNALHSYKMFRIAS